jgi:hypothetical protein
MVDAVAEAQIVAASQAPAYTRAAAAASGAEVPAASVVPEALSGVTIDGRELGPAMFGAVTTTKTFIGRGFDAQRAFEAGAAYLSLIVQTAIADAGRQADRVDATAKQVTRYVRVVQAGACSRCAVLAGKADYSTAFLRHPRCHCTSMPLFGSDNAPVPEGFYASDLDYFDSLSKSEQDRVFTNQGARAIRDGADVSQVVNARRGADLRPGGLRQRTTALSNELGVDEKGNPIKVFTTGEGTTMRGAYGRAEYRRKQEFIKPKGERYRRTANARLMPETIYQVARGDQARAVALLRQYGYIN